MTSNSKDDPENSDHDNNDRDNNDRDKNSRIHNESDMNNRGNRDPDNNDRGKYSRGNNKPDKNVSTKKSGTRRAIYEWVGIIVVAGTLYLTGLHVEVIGTLQRVLLWTGIFNAKVNVEMTDGPLLADSDYNFTFTTSDGETLRLADYRGDVVFVNVWASWCPPCVAEMPTIEKLHNSLQDRENIRFLMLCVDEDPDLAVRFMERRGFSMPYHFPVTQMPNALQGSVLPTTWVISRQGQVVYKREGIADYGTRGFRNWMIGLSEQD
ncbi:MAG: TlpA family protein disulfide reductase [Rhodothermaceae bacterium]|nr:TlpA family protein disulfide reductase [Rhodothermaceae bacterium]